MHFYQNLIDIFYINKEKDSKNHTESQKTPKYSNHPEDKEQL